MSDGSNVRNSKLTKEQKKLIYDSLTTNIIRFQEYRLNTSQEPEINQKTGQLKKKDSLKPDGAVFFEYLCYNSFKLYVEEQTSNGFFYHSYQRIEEEYGIGKERVQKITSYLKSLGVVETKVCGFPKNTHYRVRFDNLARIEVLIKLYRTPPERTKEIAAHYGEIAKVVKLRTETSQEVLDKQYPSEASWFKHLKTAYYQERQRFNKTVSAEWAIKKVQPNPREETYRNIGANLRVVYYDLDGGEYPPEETNRRIRNLTNGFRLYCTMHFFFSSNESSNSAALRKLINENEDSATWIVNYNPRDPIAYFFAKHEGGVNLIFTTFVDAADNIDFTTGYFSN